MRKQSVTIRCDGDGCQVLADVDNVQQTPFGWYHVSQASEDLKLPATGAGGWDFHDLRCVEKWSKARRIVLGEAKTSTPATVVMCPECGDELGAQGFPNHWRSRHSDISEDPPQPIKN